MASDPLSVAYPAVGLFMDEGVVAFTAERRAAGISFIHSATNCSIFERRFRVRSRWIEHHCTGAPVEWAEANTQGAVSYDPRVGRTAENPTRGVNGIIESAGGRLYRITPLQTSFSVEDISSGVRGRASMRLAWLCQAASYVIRTDGVSNTQIWDGITTVTSSGYNIDRPPASRLPNFAGPVAYGDRIWIVNRGNEIIAGDHIHRTNSVGNDDILKTTDQTYDFTSTSFPAPMEMGDILSLHLVTSARGGNLAAQAEVVAGTEGPGMWGVLAGTPRIQWRDTSMRRVVHPNVGPVGPYAAWAANDELVFRTVDGMTSIKYVNTESSQVGNPRVNIAQEIQPLLAKDPQDLLLFASMQVSITQQKLFCTVAPVVDGPHRWHRGYVSAALTPGRTRVPEAMIWEGVSTLPATMGEVIQFCEVRSVGKRRQFALLRKPDGTKGLAEWTSHHADDILADGTYVPIPWQILTRRLAPGEEYKKAGWGSLYLTLLDIRDKVTVRISARSRTSDPFTPVHEGEYTNSGWGVCNPETGEFDGYADAEPVYLGEVMKRFTGRPWIQLLVQGTGSCVVDFALGGLSSGAPEQANGTPVTCFPGERLCQFDIFNRA